MISTMEHMDEKIHLIKKKKAMTLVEVMAVIAIISIVFVGISTLMLNTVKVEKRASSLITSTNLLRSALLLFDAKLAQVDDYKNHKTISFNNLEELQDKIISADDTIGNSRYSAKIIAINIKDDIYKIQITIDDGKSSNSNEIYISK